MTRMRAGLSDLRLRDFAVAVMRIDEARDAIDRVLASLSDGEQRTAWKLAHARPERRSRPRRGSRGRR